MSSQHIYNEIQIPYHWKVLPDLDSNHVSNLPCWHSNHWGPSRAALCLSVNHKFFPTWSPLRWSLLCLDNFFFLFFSSPDWTWLESSCHTSLCKYGCLKEISLHQTDLKELPSPCQSLSTIFHPIIILSTTLTTIWPFTVCFCIGFSSLHLLIFHPPPRI